MLVGALLLTESVLREVDPDLVAILVIVGAVAWAAILAIVFERSLADDFRSLLLLAQRGDQGGDPELGTAYSQMASLLDERNRQVSTLAQQASGVPINDEPRAVVASIVSAVRRVMRDPTWRCAVLSSENAELLPPGVYHGTEDDRGPEAIEELERWAAVSRSDLPARREEGPWGAFAIVDVAVSDRVRAILYAPWEGRLRSHAGRDRPPHAGGTARRHGTRPLAAVRAGPQPGRRAQPAGRGAGRLPPWRHPRPADAAHEHRCPCHRAARKPSGPRGRQGRPRVDHPPG